jgi:alanine dehydrogenase
MADHRTYLIDRLEVERALTIADAVDAVERAFAAYGDGRAQMPPKSYLTFPKGDLRCMPAYIPEMGVATVKNVNVHPGNAGLPSVMATISVVDPETGFMLAIMDASYLTAARTGAAGAVAAKYLAREEAAVACMVGAGVQAETQLAALMVVRPGIRKVLFCDADPGRAETAAQRAAAAYGIESESATIEHGVPQADIVTTVTPVRSPIVKAEHVRPGMHINAIGADAPGKQELEPQILRGAKVVIDNWDQGSHGGEINVAVSGGLITRDDVHAEIGEVVTGRKPGRERPDEVTVFDSTGLAVQDCACAALVYQRLTADSDARARLAAVDLLRLA